MTTHRWRDVLVGIVYIIVIGALISLSIMIYNHDFTTYVQVSVHTDSVGSSLVKGSDVKVRGVLVGEVSGVSTDGQGARISLDLNPGKVRTLPKNIQAQLLPKTMFGERYVSLELPTAPSSQHLHSGDTIPQDTSRQSVELEKLFSDLLPVLQAVKPEKLAATLGELDAALRGRGNDLGVTMQTIGHYLDQLDPQIPQITADLQSFAAVAENYNTAAPDLIDALNSMSATSQTLVTQQQDFKNVLASVTAMAGTAQAFVGTNEQQIIGLSADSRPSLQIVAKYAREFPCLTQALTDFIPTANKAFGAGTKHPGAHVILHVVKASPRYTAADKPAPVTNDGAPRCPYQAANSLAGTALAGVPGVAGATATPTAGATGPSAGMGTANSPQENELIDELIAPTVGLSPAQFPRWASLLLGPVLRGTEVTLK